MKAAKVLAIILLAMFSFSIASAKPHGAKHAKHHAKHHHKKHHAHHAHHAHHKNKK